MADYVGEQATSVGLNERAFDLVNSLLGTSKVLIDYKHWDVTDSFGVIFACFLVPCLNVIEIHNQKDTHLFVKENLLFRE